MARSQDFRRRGKEKINRGGGEESGLQETRKGEDKERRWRGVRTSGNEERRR